MARVKDGDLSIGYEEWEPWFSDFWKNMKKAKEAEASSLLEGRWENRAELLDGIKVRYIERALLVGANWNDDEILLVLQQRILIDMFLDYCSDFFGRDRLISISFTGNESPKSHLRVKGFCGNRKIP